MNKATFATGDNSQISNVGLSCSPAPVVFQDTLYVFHQGSRENGQIWYIQSTDGGNSWSSDQRLSNHGMSYSPSGVVFNGKLYVFHHGSGRSGELWYTTSDGSGWSADTRISNLGISDSPSAVVFRNTLYVFHQGKGNSGQVWYTTSTNGSSWSADREISGVGMSASPSAVVFKDKLYLFHQGGSNSGELWYLTFDGSSWSSDKKMASVGLTASPSAVVFGVNALYVFHRGPGQSGELWYTVTLDGSNWDADTSISNLSASWSPGAVETMAQLAVFYQGGGDNGQLWKYIHEEMEIVDVRYDLENAQNTAVELTQLWTDTVNNNTPEPQHKSVSVAEKTTETSWFENSQSSTVDLMVGREFQVPIPFVKKNNGTSLELGLSTTQTHAYGEEESFEKAYSTTVNIDAPPYTAIKATYVVEKCTLTVPYTMTLRSNSGGETTCSGQWQGLTSWNAYTKYEEVPLEARAAKPQREVVPQ